MHGSLMIYLFVGPVRVRRAGELHRPAADRRAGHGVPKAQRLLVLALPRRRLVDDVGLPDDRVGSRLRLGRLRPAFELDQHPGSRARSLDRRPDPHRFLRDLHGCQPGQHDLLPARSGNDHVPDADLHLEHARDRHPDPHRLPGVHERADPALVRPPSRRSHLHGRRWGRPRPLAGPLLVLRPPGGLHPRPALLRDRHRRALGLLPQADLRLPRHGIRDDVHRRPVDERLGAPHVHHGRRAAALLQPDVLPDRGADGDQVLQLDRHDVARVGEVRHPHAVRDRVPRDLPARRGDRHPVGLAADRLRDP